MYQQKRVMTSEAPSLSEQQRTLEETIKECREYIQLKNKNSMERNPQVGAAMYLLSKEWLRRYKTYILYSDVKRNNKPVLPDTIAHPGPISNDEELCMPTDRSNLTGTGTNE